VTWIASGDCALMSADGSGSSSVGNNLAPRMGVSVALPVARPALPLAVDEVHVWLADLQQSVERRAMLAATLTTDEQERAARFRFPEQQDRFIVGRGLLRELLGAYLDRPAPALRFGQGAQGKPTLAGPDAGAGLHFNLSHSGERALYAVAHRELGVDLECVERTVSHAAVAERVCSLREWAAFQALSAEELHEAFFACWTRKEAIAKAMGSGLASGLRALEVCFPEDGTPDGRVTLRDGQEREWTVLNLLLERGWSGALAAAGAGWRWRGWRWG